MVTADWRSQTLGTSPLSLLTIQYCPSSWRTQDMRTGIAAVNCRTVSLLIPLTAIRWVSYPGVGCG